MKARLEKLIPWLVVLLPVSVVALSALLMIWYFSERLSHYERVQTADYFQEALQQVQAQSQVRTTDLIALMQYQNGRLESTMKSTLESRVGVAYDTAQYLYEKYRERLDETTLKALIKDALSQMVWASKNHYIWITDFSGNNLLAANVQMQEKNLFDYQDAQGRYIIREEIALAQTKGQGILRSHFVSKDNEELMYIKNFGHYDWLLGSALDMKQGRKALQEKLLKMIADVVWEPNAFVMILDGKGRLLAHSHSPVQPALPKAETVMKLTQKHWVQHGDLFLRREDVGVFGWQIVSGFASNRFLQTFDLRSQQLSEATAEEKITIIKTALLIALAVAFLALILARKINAVFNRYREQVRLRENALREFNASLEARVEEEVQKQRQSEKMLIQQSKMAAMGDMISMIAHQWRQPLNQLSYMLMNIEGAYEQNELSPAYLKEKMGEAEKTLEYMSQTIDDFRDFFRPDKMREPVDLSLAVTQTLKLLGKSLASHNISVETQLECAMTLPLYRNEIIQVMINLIQNAKDALVMRRIALPRIEIECYETGQFIVIRICDNGGGVDAEIADRIFEPYFSSKERMHGTGLGLYMSRTIVEEHFNGELIFDNLGEGACFYIKIGKHQSDD